MCLDKRWPKRPLEPPKLLQYYSSKITNFYSTSHNLFLWCAWIAAGPNAPWAPQTAPVLRFEEKKFLLYESLLFEGGEIPFYKSVFGLTL